MRSGDLFKPKEVNPEEFYRKKLDERTKKPHVPKVGECVKLVESMMHFARGGRGGGEEEEDEEPIVITTTRPKPIWSDSKRVFECDEIHEKLREKGVRVSKEIIQKALLPPPSLLRGEWRLPANYSGGLLSSPVTWFSRS